LKRGGKAVVRWTRELLPDLNTMRITQHGVTPAGGTFQNMSLYRRSKQPLRRSVPLPEPWLL
jgi:hypothetical protein